MTTRAARRRPLYLVTLSLVIAGGCSDSESGGADTTPSTVVATTEAVPTTEVAPSTTAAPEIVIPTVAPPIGPAPAFLRGNGLGAFDFGAPAADVGGGVPLAVVSDRVAEFPVDSGGLFLSLDGSESFDTPFGREICWNDGGGGTLCAYFAGVDAASLLLAGWEYTGTPGVEGRLFSSSAVTVSILATSVPSMPVPLGACYSYTSVQLDGISIDLNSPSDTWFGTYGDDGSWIPAVPQPADARVTAMGAGAKIYPVSDGAVDC